MTDDDLLQRIWKLTNDLTLQQQTNQDIAAGIKTQFDNFKDQKSSDTTNDDNDNEDDDDDQNFAELVPANPINDADTELVSLVSKHTKLLQEHHRIKNRNQELERECAELQDLVHQYESSLELVAGKLRTFASGSSEGQIQLRREYEALLDAEKDTTTALFMENTILQAQLAKLSGVLRSVVHEQDSLVSYDSQIQQLKTENQGLRTLLAISEQQQQQQPLVTSPSSHQAQSSSGSSPLSKKSVISLQPAKPPNKVIQDYFGDSR
ncbi:uncharacterized protein BX664DRAFT_366217 [Halteromyces radiatus]|uniref:uncharacterized protein n=1 Tax=Halteromyces radiatus TaxID=101107 RepID=UPI002220154B|nr:uncharacterized protein BX664DRAFT_366217 [Halteromyces radiatus]KAI8084563.1 hypothetical protein BX664DRAFT_366217 [Halteromyces radiatus]